MGFGAAYLIVSWSVVFIWLAGRITSLSVVCDHPRPTLPAFKEIQYLQIHCIETRTYSSTVSDTGGGGRLPRSILRSWLEFLSQCPAALVPRWEHTCAGGPSCRSSEALPRARSPSRSRYMGLVMLAIGLIWNREDNRLVTTVSV